MNKNELEQARKIYEQIKDIKEAFNMIALNTEECANIYIFIGYYSNSNIVENKISSSIAKTNPYSKYKYYVNIETCEIKCISIKNSLEFEEKNKIIFLDNEEVYHSKMFYKNKFNEIRNEYFQELTKKPQEEAVKKFIKQKQVK